MSTFAQLVSDGLLAVGDGYRAKNEELGTEGPIFLRSAYLQDQGWVIDSADRVSRPNAPDLGTKTAQVGDTVLTTKGNSLGRLGYADSQIAGAIYSPHLSYWRSLDHRSINPRYLYYWAHSPSAVAQIKARSQATDMAPYLSLRDQLGISVALPSIEVQDAVSDVLGVLDDKIDLNRRMAGTLAAIARALYKSWFVDFEPIHTKSTGGSRPLPDDVAVLFPSAFSDYGLPDGWTIRTVNDLFEVSGGNTPSTQVVEYWGGQHQWATPKDLSTLRAPVLLRTERQITDVGLSRSTSGLLPAGTLLLSSRAPIGYMAFATRPVAINQGFAGFVRKEVSTVYAWCWCAENMDVITGNASGSTFPEISKSALRRLPMLAPSPRVFDAFERTAEPLVARMVAAVQQSETLAALRNTLLPRLISGELRIRDAERALAAG